MIDWNKYIDKDSPRESAKKLAAYGRNGDSMLMHVTPLELDLMKATGGITTNPNTGLPEGFLLLGSILAGLASAASAAAPIAGALGSALPAIGSAIASGAGFGAPLATLTAAAAPGAGVLLPAAAGTSIAAPAVAGIGGGAALAGLGGAGSYGAPALAGLGGTAGTWAPAAAQATSGFGKVASGLGHGVKAVGEYAVAHPAQSLMAMYGIGTLADNLRSKDDLGVQEEPDEDYRTNPDYIASRARNIQSSMPSPDYYKSGLAPHQYFTRV